MKKHLQFTIDKEIEKDEIVISTNEKGEEVKTTKKVKTKEPRKFFIAKPGRALSEDAELYYNSVYWKCVKDYGIQPSIQLQKRYLDDDGVLSKEQKKEYADLNVSFFEKQAKYQQLNSKTDKTEEEIKETELLLTDTVSILEKIQTFETQMGNALYQNTAENIARNRTATWWMLHIAYEDLGGTNFKPIFGAGELKDRLKVYDRIEETEDAFEIEMVKKLLLATSLWYFQKVQTQEEFDLMLKMYENAEVIESAKVVEEVANAKDAAPTT